MLNIKKKSRLKPKKLEYKIKSAFKIQIRTSQVTKCCLAYWSKTPYSPKKMDVVTSLMSIKR